MDIIRIAEEAKQAFENAKKAEERLRKAKERVHRARKRRQQAVQRFLSAYRKTTGISIRQTQLAVEWMAEEIHQNNLFGDEGGDMLDYFKIHCKQMIDEAKDWEKMMQVINQMAYIAKREVALKNLAKHKEALEAARRLNFLSDDDIATIMQYGGKEVD